MFVDVNSGKSSNVTSNFLQAITHHYNQTVPVIVKMSWICLFLVSCHFCHILSKIQNTPYLYQKEFLQLIITLISGFVIPPSGFYTTFVKLIWRIQCFIFRIIVLAHILVEIQSVFAQCYIISDSIFGELCCFKCPLPGCIPGYRNTDVKIL